MRRTLMCTALLVLAAALVIPPAGAQTGPAIQIVSPRQNATVSGSLAVIEVRVRNFMLAPAGIGKAAKPGQGHWAVFVDGKPAGLSADEVVSIPNDAYPILTAGKHTINVELRNNDRTPVAGAENSEITVTVAAKSAMKYAPALVRLLPVLMTGAAVAAGACNRTDRAAGASASTQAGATASENYPEPR